jgi:hypothetical protein
MLTECDVDVASRARDVAGERLPTPTPSRPQAGSLPFPATIAPRPDGSMGSEPGVSGDVYGRLSALGLDRDRAGDLRRDGRRGHAPGPSS